MSSKVKTTKKGKQSNKKHNAKAAKGVARKSAMP